MLKLFIILLIGFSSYAQQAQRSPFDSQYMYYFYSYQDQLELDDFAKKIGSKTGGGIYLLLGKDTVRMTQMNDSLKPIRDNKDIKYLGKGVEECFMYVGAKVYIKFKEFVKK